MSKGLVRYYENQGLTWLSAAHTALDRAKNMEDFKGITDEAKLAEALAKVTHDDELERNAALIRTRAVRALGKLRSRQNPGPGRPANKSPKTGNKNPNENSEIRKPPTDKELGIDKTTSNRARELATLPDEVYEKTEKRIVNAGEKVTPSKVISATKPVPRPLPAEVQDFDEKLRMFKQIKYDPEALLAADLEMRLRWVDEMADVVEYFNRVMKLLK